MSVAMRLFPVIMAVAFGAPVNMHLRRNEIQASAPAPAAAGAPGPAPCPPGPCCDEIKAKEELDGMEADGSKKYMDKYHEAEDLEQQCEQEKADKAKKKANKETKKEWTKGPERTPGPHVVAK
eukprot:gnl/TRDRNA2_/TRDRNA2_84966_c0_seq2.p2 gnl/TRDRNA2_/TRDRNA2_84966_c0~~gnl/TRDRNA2_/TRDRNA2_84966_c0_seq2.p2  ORF type:complete len:123 (+),score=44.93 gnl/TRDRNA2_/TRDRNA2_84966_c0_seq2:82-450(+)